MNLQTELREVLLESWGRKIVQNLIGAKTSRPNAPRTAPRGAPRYDILEFVKAQKNKDDNPINGKTPQ